MEGDDWLDAERMRIGQLRPVVVECDDGELVFSWFNPTPLNGESVGT